MKDELCLKCLFVRYFGLSHDEAFVISELYFWDFFLKWNLWKRNWTFCIYEAFWHRNQISWHSYTTGFLKGWKVKLVKSFCTLLTLFYILTILSLAVILIVQPLTHQKYLSKIIKVSMVDKFTDLYLEK